MQTLTHRIITSALHSKLPIAIFALSLLAGILALQWTPREEEPQIVVPMIDVLVSTQALSAEQVERQVTTPLEKLLSQISGVENIYSSTMAGKTSVTLRFFVGEDREDALLNTYNKLYSNQDGIPAVVEQWLVRPVEVDDVPILLLGLWADKKGSSDSEHYDDYQLRRIAQELSTALESIPQTSEVKVVGGRPRSIYVHLDPEALTAHQTSVIEVISALHVSNERVSAGDWLLGNRTFELQAGEHFHSVAEIENIAVNVINGAPVWLKDVARVVDGPADATSLTWIDFTAAHPAFSGQDDALARSDFPMVSISVAKQRGSNAVEVSQNVHALLAEQKQRLLPESVHIEVLRDYGRTADEKVNNLVESLAFAIFTVVVFIGVFLGWRQAWVVALAVPICYGMTLALDMAFGYTINRVTLFALILALGLLVDDPITGVDNITRYLSGNATAAKGLDRDGRIVAAIEEIRSPLIMSTLTIVLAFIPLAFISGMMGPYMAPMAFNVPVSILASMVVAFLVTPWLSKKLLRSADIAEERPANSGWMKFYPRLLQPMLDNPRRAKLALWGVLVVFLIACSLPMFRLIPLKLLPFDNKNEVQVLVEMPASASLEETAAMAKQISVRVAQMPEVLAIASFVGVPSPIDFNGMVRGYYQRAGNQYADLRITLADKWVRAHQSHGIVLRLRELLKDLSANDLDGQSVLIKVVEVPPGPPVLSTLVAEVYGSGITDYATQIQAAEALAQRLKREAHVVEVEISAKSGQPVQRFVADKQKAALSGVASADINQTLLAANAGVVAGHLQFEREAVPLPIVVQLPETQRHSEADLLRIHVKGRPGVIKTSNDSGLDSAAQPLVALGELGQFEPHPGDTMIHHKDLQPVVYVMAELNGRTPAEIVADVSSDQNRSDQNRSDQNRSDQTTTQVSSADITDWQARTFLASGAGDHWSVPAGIDVKWTGEGEWKITVDVFRDMGIAFAFALVAIFIVLRIETQSVALALIIMSAIPLTMIGIMPGFWLLNQFGERVIAGAPEPVLFTATAMIGMIALAGIVVRNSLILVEFITQARNAGMALKKALVQAGMVRMRPVLLTAGTTLLGNVVIILDPVFSGLALALIFGLISSTLFTLVVVPVVYYLVFRHEDLHSEGAIS